MCLIVLFMISYSQEICFVLPQYANMRSSNSTNSQVVSTLRRGQMVISHYKTGNWNRVEYQGEYGYIYAPLLLGIDNLLEHSTEITSLLEVGSCSGFTYTVSVPLYENLVPIYVIVYPSELPRDDSIVDKHLQFHIREIWGEERFLRKFYLHEEWLTNLLAYSTEHVYFKFFPIRSEISGRIGVLLCWCEDKKGTTKPSKFEVYRRIPEGLSDINVELPQNRVSPSNIKDVLYNQYNRYGVDKVQCDTKEPLVIMHVNETLYRGFLMDKINTEIIFNQMISLIKNAHNSNSGTLFIFFNDSKVIRAQTRVSGHGIDVKYY